MHFADSIAGITGETSGIGFATAKLLDQAGAHTVLLGRDIEKGEAAARSLTNGVFVQTDLSRGGDIPAIVNIGSMWAHQAVKATPSSAYSMAKAGLHALTQHLAMELAEYLIRANTTAPAVVETPVYEAFIPREQVSTALQGFNAFHPIGRIGQAGEVAHAVKFLLSDDTAWTTGAVLNVDGGVMAGRN